MVIEMFYEPLAELVDYTVSAAKVTVDVEGNFSRDD